MKRVPPRMRMFFLGTAAAAATAAGEATAEAARRRAATGLRAAWAAKEEAVAPRWACDYWISIKFGRAGEGRVSRERVRGGRGGEGRRAKPGTKAPLCARRRNSVESSSNGNGDAGKERKKTIPTAPLSLSLSSPSFDPRFEPAPIVSIRDPVSN